MKSNDSNEKPAPPRKRGSKENDRLKGSKDGGKDAGKGHHGSRDSALPAGGGIGAGAVSLFAWPNQLDLCYNISETEKAYKKVSKKKSKGFERIIKIR